MTPSPTGGGGALLVFDALEILAGLEVVGVDAGVVAAAADAIGAAAVSTLDAVRPCGVTALKAVAVRRLLTPAEEHTLVGSVAVLSTFSPLRDSYGPVHHAAHLPWLFDWRADYLVSIASSLCHMAVRALFGRQDRVDALTVLDAMEALAFDTGLQEAVADRLMSLPTVAWTELGLRGRDVARLRRHIAGPSVSACMRTCRPTHRRKDAKTH